MNEIYKLSIWKEFIEWLPPSEFAIWELYEFNSQLGHFIDFLSTKGVKVREIENDYADHIGEYCFQVYTTPDCMEILFRSDLMKGYEAAIIEGIKMLEK